MQTLKILLNFVLHLHLCQMQPKEKIVYHVITGKPWEAIAAGIVLQITTANCAMPQSPIALSTI